MLVFLNGRFIPEEQAVVSVLDRGFLYGDGLFETLRVRNGRLFRWPQHLARLHAGAKHLGISMPGTEAALLAAAGQLVARNNLPNAILRLTISRGVGPRGYSPRGAHGPTLVMTLHPVPETPPARWKLITATTRLPAGDPLAQFKTCNKLPQILARAEADAAGADEALLLSTEGHVVEAAAANLFWVADRVICTPPLPDGILPGVTRAVVIELCHALGLAVRETSLTPGKLQQTDGVFLSLSTWGVVEAAELDGHSLRQSPLLATVREGYAGLLESEPG